MKIQAFPIIAVVAALLPVLNCAPAKYDDKKDDRSCTKRDEDARKEKGPVEGCNYFCKPYEDLDFYEEKHYPDGVLCMYSNTLVSKCKNKKCHYPEKDMEQNKPKKNETEKGQNDEGSKQDKDEGKDNEKGGTGEVSTEGSEQGKENTTEKEVNTEKEEKKEEDKKEEEKKEEEKKEEKEEKKEEEKDKEKKKEEKEEEKKEGELSQDAEDTAKTK
ncbi:cilia- and flagella-associated protein 251-like [Ixodes scapularis]|uniref:cilia- and flagella-associated protein 251-like n=1 Tax=Ixodes scapularis TaxID=6945 RepID=UPI001C38C0EF|nr:cilia- and flagella-associated protein 251-like [Ixodes scapularis]